MVQHTNNLGSDGNAFPARNSQAELNGQHATAGAEHIGHEASNGTRVTPEAAAVQPPVTPTDGWWPRNRHLSGLIRRMRKRLGAKFTPAIWQQIRRCREAYRAYVREVGKLIKMSL